MGRQPDPGRLRVALHRQERAPLVGRARRQHGARRDLLPGARGDRGDDHAEIRNAERDGRHPGRQRRHFRLRPADRLLRRPLWGGHRSPDPRRRFWIHWLDRHVAHLRLFYLHLLRHRIRHPFDGARTLFRIAAPDRLFHQRDRDHPIGHLRHHADQPVPIVHPAVLGAAEPASVRRDRLWRSRRLHPMEPLLRPARRPIRRAKPPPVWKRRIGRLCNGGAGRRTGRLSPLSAARPAHLQAIMVDRVVERGPRLDRHRRAEAAGRLVSRLLRDQARPRGGRRRRSGAHISRGFPLRVRAAAARPRPHRRLRRALAGQDQRHQRLCRIDRLVEFLLAPHPQPSRPRRLAGLQRRRGAAADGDRRL